MSLSELMAFLNLIGFAASLASEDQDAARAIVKFVEVSGFKEIALVKQIESSSNKERVDNIAEAIIKGFNGDVTFRISNGIMKELTNNKESIAIMLADNTFWTKGAFVEGKLLLALVGGAFNLGNVFHSLWKRMVCDVNVLVWRANSSSIAMTTFKPYDGESCNDTSPKLVNEFVNDQWSSMDFFPDKFTNLNRCPLRVATYESPPAMMINATNEGLKVFGFEGDLFNEVSSLLNFTMIFEIVEDGSGIIKLYENGTAFGINKKVLDGEVDFIVSLLSFTSLRAKFMSATKPYFVDGLIAIVPPPSEVSPIMKIFCGFNAFVWLTLLIAAIAIVAVYEGLRILNPRFYYERVVGRNISTPYLNMFNASLGGSFHRLPYKSSARYLLAMQLIFFLVVRSMYQGALFHVMKSHNYVNNIKTWGDINRLGYSFYLTEGMASKTSGMLNTKSKVIFHSRDADAYRLKTLSQDFRGVFLDYLAKTLHHNELNYRDHSFRICKEILMPSFIVAYMRKNHFLIDKIDEKIEALKSNGMLANWIKKYTKTKQASTNSDVILSKLTMAHLLGAFEILIYGLTISFAAFTTEFIACKMKSHKALVSYVNKYQV